MKQKTSRILSVLLLVTIIFGLRFPALAQEEPISVSYISGIKAELLCAMGIIDAQLEGEHPVTRGELIKLVYKLRNIKVGANYGDSIIFYDIKKGDELYEEVMTLYSLGIINGYPDRTIRAEESATCLDAVIMLLNMAGYRNYVGAGENGLYGYLKTAGDVGLLKGVALWQNENLEWETAVNLTYNALFIPVCERNSFSGDGEKCTMSGDKDVLSEYHSIYKNEGVMEANSILTLGKSNARDGYIAIDGKYYLCDNMDYQNLVGYRVGFYYYDEEDRDPRIIYAHKHKKVSELYIPAQDLLSFEDNIITYLVDDKIQKAKIAEGHELVRNGVHQTSYDDSIFEIRSGSITLVSNEGDNEYSVVFIDTYVNYIVDSVDYFKDDYSMDGVIRKGGVFTLIPKYSLSKVEIDLSDKDVRYELKTADGKYVDNDYYLKNAKGCVVSVYADTLDVQRGYPVASHDATFYRFILSDKSVTGTATEIDYGDAKIYIDGTQYEMYENNFLSEENFEIGLSGTFLLDFNDRVTGFIPGENDGSMQYGYLIRAAKQPGISSTLEFKLLNRDGEVKIYKGSRTFKVNGEKKSANEAITSLENSAKLIDESTSSMSQLVKFRLNDNGEITELQTVLQPIGRAQGADPDHLWRAGIREQLTSRTNNGNALYTSGSSSVGSYVIKYHQPQIVFQVPVVETGNDDDYGILVTWGEEEPRTVEVYNLSPAYVPEAAVVYHAAGIVLEDLLSDRCLFMVNRITTAIDDEGSQVSVLYGCDGKNANVKFYGQKADTFDGLKTGDLITLKGYKSRNIVVSWTMVQAFDSLPDIATIPDVAVGSMTYNYGQVYCMEANRLLVQKGPVIDEVNKLRSDLKGAFWSSSTSYLRGRIVYDATGNKPEIRVASQSTDVFTVYKDGEDKASKIFFVNAYGTIAFIVIYNGV